MVTKELVGIQIKIQIAGSVAKFAIRKKCSNGFTYDVSMYSGVPQWFVKMPVSLHCSFQSETASSYNKASASFFYRNIKLNKMKLHSQKEFTLKSTVKISLSSPITY